MSVTEYLWLMLAMMPWAICGIVLWWIASL